MHRVMSSSRFDGTISPRYKSYVSSDDSSLLDDLSEPSIESSRPAVRRHVLRASRDPNRIVLPRIGILCAYKTLEIAGCGALHYNALYTRYLDTLVSRIPCTPLLIAGVAESAGAAPQRLADEYVELLDGLLLPGAISNVAPELYGGALPEAESHRDARRDAIVMPLVVAAVSAGVPILGICRGMQELNVALGGSLVQRVHEIPGRRDHRSPKDRPFIERYRPAHDLTLTPGGWLEHAMRRAGLPTTGLSVNSLHGQAVDRLGRGIEVEACAEDGTIEAIRAVDAPALTIGVQWHAEWYVDECPPSAVIFDEFARACGVRARSRVEPDTRQRVAS